MASEKRYYANDQMAEMVEGNYRILLILSRFGIGMGFCEKSIGEVCADAGVDVGTFLAIVNIALESPPCEVCDTLDPAEARDEGVGVDTEILIRYLCEGHRYFLSRRLPAIRNELMSVWNEPQSDLYRVMMRYFDDFAASVASHARHEEQSIFPYFRALVDGQRPQPLERHLDEHYEIRDRLREMRQLLVNYYTEANVVGVYDLLARICICEWELAAHARVEALLVESMIARMEMQLNMVEA